MKKYIGIFLVTLVLVGGCSLSSLNPFKSAEVDDTQQGVNHYLWQASLDKLSSLPIEIEDLTSGKIVTEWTKMQGSPNELFKVEVDVLSRELRSDGLKVTVVKKEFKNGRWSEQKANKLLAVEIENQILLKARELFRKDMKK